MISDGRGEVNVGTKALALVNGRFHAFVQSQEIWPVQTGDQTLKAGAHHVCTAISVSEDTMAEADYVLTLGKRAIQPSDGVLRRADLT